MANADITAIVTGDTRLLDEALNKAVAKPRKVNLSINNDLSGSLGRIRAQLGEFDKSLAASNARVLAFGASAGAMYAVGRSIKELVNSTVQVEKRLTSINSILGASRSEFGRFGNELFRIAQETSSSFDDVADAAEELARQGVGIEETLKRTSSAMKLVRISGVSAVTAVEAMTAALNTNNDVLLTSESLINKLAAVDAKFAVSAAGLTEALKRVGSVAVDAGFSIDELIAAVTSAQQTTARGEAVIGNSLKTIFTRAQRPKVLEDFQSLGIETKNAAGNIRPLKEILIEVAKQYDNLSSAQQSNISELVGGVYQINILKALFRDLGKETSIFGRAFEESFGATDQASQRVAQLNETLDALFKRFSVNLTKFGSQSGNAAFAPLGKSLLKGMNTVLEGVTSELGDKNDVSGRIMEGLFKGLGNALSGPLLVGGLAVLIKLLRDWRVQGMDAIKTLSGLNKSFHSLEIVTSSVGNFLREHPNHLLAISTASKTAEGSTRALAAATADYVKWATQKAEVDQLIGRTSGIVARGAVAQGVFSAPAAGRGETLQVRRASAGLLPEISEKIGAYAGGYKPGQVRDMNVPGMGRIYYNTAEKVKWFPGMAQPAIIPPRNSRAGQNYEREFSQRHGFDPYMAGGMIPNFATVGLPRISNSEISKRLSEAFSKGADYKDFYSIIGGAFQNKSDAITFGGIASALSPRVPDYVAGPASIAAFKYFKQTGSQSVDDYLNLAISGDVGNYKTISQLGFFGPKGARRAGLKKALTGQTLARRDTDKTRHYAEALDGNEDSFPIDTNVLRSIFGKTIEGTLKIGDARRLIKVARKTASGLGVSPRELQAGIFKGVNLRYADKYNSDYIQNLRTSLTSDGLVPNFAQTHGFDPYMANGLVPNFALTKKGNRYYGQYHSSHRSLYLDGLLNGKDFQVDMLRKSGKGGALDFFADRIKTDFSQLGVESVSFTPDNSDGRAHIRERAFNLFLKKNKIKQGLYRDIFSSGLIPNFSPLSSAIAREAGSVNSSLIRVGSHSSLRGPGNPDGMGVYNLRDEPLGLGQGVERAKSMGLNPKTHGIPNFAFEKQKEWIFGNESSPGREGAFSKALAASFIPTAITSATGTSDSLGGKIATEITDALSLGLTIAAFARGKGGKGLAIGTGLLSGFMGVVKQSTNSFNTLDAEVNDLKNKIQKAGDGMGMYGQTLEQLQNAYLDSSVKTVQIVKLQDKLAQTLAGLPEELRRQLMSAKTLEQVQDIGSRYSEARTSEFQQKELALTLSTNLNSRNFRRGSLIESSEKITEGMGKSKLEGVADIILSALVNSKGLEKIGGAAGLSSGDFFTKLKQGGISGSVTEQLSRVRGSELDVIKSRLIGQAGTRETDMAKIREMMPEKQRFSQQLAALEKQADAARKAIKQTFESIGQMANLRLKMGGRQGIMRATGINEEIQGLGSLMSETSSPDRMAITNYRSQLASNQLKAVTETSEVFAELRSGISDLFNQIDLSRMGDIPANVRGGQSKLLSVLGGQNTVGGIGEGAISIFKALGKDEGVNDIKKLMADSNEKLVDIQQTLREGNKIAEIQRNIAIQRAEFDRSLKTGGGLSSFLDRGDKYGKMSDIYGAQFGYQSGIFKGQGAIELVRSYLGAGGKATDSGVSGLLGTAKEERALDIIETQKDLNRAFAGSGLKLGVPNISEARKLAETQIAAELKTGDSDMERQMAGLERALQSAISSSFGGQMSDAAQVFANVLAGSDTFRLLNSTLEKNTQVLGGLEASLKGMRDGVNTSSIALSARAGGNIPIAAAGYEKMMAKAGGYNPGSIRRAGNLIYNSAERVDYLPGIREPVISPPPGSLAGFLHRQNFRGLGFAAGGSNPYLFVPTTTLDEDQIKAIKKAGYNPLDVNAREAYRKGKLSIPKGSKVIDPTMAFTGGGAGGWETPLSKAKARNLSILTGVDPGMTDKLMETRMMRGLPKSEDLVEVLKRHNISTKGKIDIAAHQGLLEKEFGKGFFIKAKEGVQSRGVYSQNKLFGGFSPETGTGLRSLEQNRPKLGAKRFFVQSGIPNTSERVFRVSTLGTEEGAKVLGKSQIRMVRGSIETDAFAQLYDQGKLVTEGDALAHRTATGEIAREISKKELRENLISRRIADAQAKRAMKSLPANLRAGALAGMDVAETGYTGVMKRLQLLAEETGIGHRLFKGGGVIEPNFSDKLGYSGALQKADLSIEVAKELESLEKSRASSPVASENVVSPARKVSRRDSRGRFIGKPKPIMGSQLNVGLNTAPINSGIKLGQIGYASPSVSGINFEGGSTPTGDYKPGISDQGYRPTSARTPTASQISNLRKVAITKKYAETGAKGVGAAGRFLGGAIGGRQFASGWEEVKKAGEENDIWKATKGVLDQASGVGGILASSGVGAAVGVALALPREFIRTGENLGELGAEAYGLYEDISKDTSGKSKPKLLANAFKGMMGGDILGDEAKNVWNKKRKTGPAGFLADALTFAPKVLGKAASKMLIENPIDYYFGEGSMSPTDKAAREAYNPGNYYRGLREKQEIETKNAARQEAVKAYQSTSGTRFQQEQFALTQGMSPADRVTYFKQQMSGKYGQWGSQEDYQAGLSRASTDANRDTLAKRYNITAPGQLDRLHTGLTNAAQLGKTKEYVAQLEKAYKGTIGRQPIAEQPKPKTNTEGDKTKLDININMGGNLGLKNTSVEFSEEQYLIINAMIATVSEGIEKKIKAITDKLPAETRSNVANATPPQAGPSRATPYGV